MSSWPTTCCTTFPDPERAAAEFARVLTPTGVLIAATNGPNHLDAVRELSQEVFGWSSLNSAIGRFGPENGAHILGSAFGAVTWHAHPSTMVCTDPEDVYAFIVSSGSGHESTQDRLDTLRRTIERRFAAEGGSLKITTEAGCLVADDPRAEVHAQPESKPGAPAEGPPVRPLAMPMMGQWSARARAVAVRPPARATMSKTRRRWGRPGWAPPPPAAAHGREGTRLLHSPPRPARHRLRVTQRVVVGSSRPDRPSRSPLPDRPACVPHITRPENGPAHRAGHCRHRIPRRPRSGVRGE